MEAHTVFMGQFQGWIALPFVHQLLATNHTDGLQTLFPTCIGRCRNMIGKGTTKGEQRVFTLFFCFEQVVFEFSVFVSGNKRMDGILPFQVELNALFAEKR